MLLRGVRGLLQYYYVCDRGKTNSKHSELLFGRNTIENVCDLSPRGPPPLLLSLVCQSLSGTSKILPLILIIG